MRQDELELVVFVGLQAAGKTTCYRCCFAGTHEHISKDTWPNARHRLRHPAPDHRRVPPAWTGW
jgi:hypothetical protein